MEEQLEIQVMEASDVQARIRVRHRGDHSAGAELSGTITGPRCETSRTLPATIAFQAGRDGDIPVAEALLPDPCFWSPELPFLYDLSLELRRSDQTVESAKFSIALYPKRVVKQ